MNDGLRCYAGIGRAQKPYYVFRFGLMPPAPDPWSYLQSFPCAIVPSGIPQPGRNHGKRSSYRAYKTTFTLDGPTHNKRAWCCNFMPLC